VSSPLLTKPLPYIALFIAFVIWGGNFVVAKITLQEFPPMTLAFFRFALASLFLAPFFLAQTKKSLPAGRQVKLDKKDLPRLIAVGILIVTLNIAFFLEGMRRTTAINASVLSLTTPILSVWFGWWFLKEKIFFVNILGVILGLLGALIIIGLPQLLTGNYSPQETLGNVLIVLASISWVVGGIIAKPILNKYPTMIVTAIVFMVGTLTFFIPASSEYIQNPAWVNHLTILGILGLAYMTLLSSISAYFLYEWGLSKTSFYKSNLFQYIEPFIAGTLAVSILGEKISSTFLVGSLLIAASAILGTLAKLKTRHHHHKAHRV